MRLKHYMLFLLTMVNIIHAQGFIENTQIGNFTNAASIAINPSGFIYVTDSQTNEIYKIDTLGTLIKTTGGYGWSEGSFDNPIDIYANVLNVYIADKNNHRIELYDKDLNFLSQFSTQNSTESNYSFNYPTGITVSNQGDLYILDSDNKRVLKFNLRGEFLNSVGSIDAGRYQLSNPIKLCLDSFSNLVVLEPNLLTVFDQFGNGLFRMNISIPAINMNSYFGTLVLVDNSNVMMIHTDESSNQLVTADAVKLNLDEDIVDAALFNSKLYILTKSSIHVFNIIKQ